MHEAAAIAQRDLDALFGGGFGEYGGCHRGEVSGRRSGRQIDQRAGEPRKFEACHLCKADGGRLPGRDGWLETGRLHPEGYQSEHALLCCAEPCQTLCETQEWHDTAVLRSGKLIIARALAGDENDLAHGSERLADGCRIMPQRGQRKADEPAGCRGYSKCCNEISRFWSGNDGNIALRPHYAVQRLITPHGLKQGEVFGSLLGASRYRPK